MVELADKSLAHLGTGHVAGDTNTKSRTFECVILGLCATFVRFCSILSVVVHVDVADGLIMLVVTILLPLLPWTLHH